MVKRFTMEYIRHNTNIQLKNTAVALGKFDGLHKGHQLLIDEIIQKKADGMLSTVFTFDTSPVKVVANTYDGMLMTGAERADYLQQQGVDVVIEYPFTHDFSQMEPEAFVSDILIRLLDTRFLVVGEDFHFGRHRSGDVALLHTLSKTYGFELRVKQKIKKAPDTSAAPISSTLIKTLIRKGDVEAANDLMGHFYTISGTVIYGNQLGRTLSYPTANISIPEEKVLPPYGVYAVRVCINDNIYYGIANLGTKPTVSNKAQVGLETFIFDFSDNIYGQEIKVGLLKFLRQEAHFDTVEALSFQIGQDVLCARKYLS